MVNRKLNSVALLLVLIVVFAGCRRGETAVDENVAQTTREAGQTTTGTEIGSALPEYTAMNLDGSRFDLETRGNKVVLLNLWATWCGPCLYEIPELQRIHDEFGPKGFEVVGISVDEGPVETIKQFVAEQKVTYPIAVDPEGKLATLLSTSVLPTSVLLDRSGRIIWKKYGVILENDKELQDAITKAL